MIKLLSNKALKFFLTLGLQPIVICGSIAQFYLLTKLTYTNYGL